MVPQEKQLHSTYLELKKNDSNWIANHPNKKEFGSAVCKSKHSSRLGSSDLLSSSELVTFACALNDIELHLLDN